MNNVKPLSKKALENGMIVETRGGKQYLVLLGANSSVSINNDVLIGENGFMPLGSYDKDLKVGSYVESYDIVKVYQKCVFSSGIFKGNDDLVMREMTALDVEIETLEERLKLLKGQRDK